MYNASAHIAEAIRAVKAQTLSDWEMIIVDDASTDSSLDVAHRCAEGDERIRIFSLKENSGSAFRPRLAALQDAAGEYIVELDADDTIEPAYLLKLSRALTTAPSNNPPSSSPASSLATNPSDNSNPPSNPSLPPLPIDAAFARFIRPDGTPVLSDELPPSTHLTGAEALAATFGGWRHSAMGAIRRRLYTDALERFGMPDAGICSDEVLTRRILACASEVVITDALYIYTPNPHSVTRHPTLKLFDPIESAFAALSLSNLVGSRDVWQSASREFYHAFIHMAHLYHTFVFESQADNNDVRLRLRNMFDRLADQRFRRVIPLPHRMAMKTGFATFMKLIALRKRQVSKN